MSFAGELVKATKEAWQNRIRVDVSGALTSDPRIGHTVRIRNVGTKPLVLQHWEIQAGRFLRRKHVESSAAIFGGEMHDDTLDPMRAKTLEFKDMYYFGAPGKLSFRLWFAGRSDRLGGPSLERPARPEAPTRPLRS